MSIILLVLGCTSWCFCWTCMQTCDPDKMWCHLDMIGCGMVLLLDICVWCCFSIYMWPSGMWYSEFSLTKSVLSTFWQKLSILVSDLKSAKKWSSLTDKILFKHVKVLLSFGLNRGKVTKVFSIVEAKLHGQSRLFIAVLISLSALHRTGVKCFFVSKNKD